ncbi:ABC transporter permease [Kitasatospora sp. NPDC056783]|uniref:ABC transporter permease n=1 Tax=Kitasatospora sp. NPDC056783 TaxID=3345943 RepID=UPI00368F511C
MRTIVATLLARIQRRVRRRLRQTTDEPRLRGAQAELLILVRDNPGPRISEAAEELCLAGNSVSTLANQLAAPGLLHRESDPADRRATLLHATPQALERTEAWRRRRRALMNDTVAALPPEDRAALDAALPALRRVADGLRTPTPRAALVTGKAFAVGVKAVLQAAVVVLIAAALGVALTWNPLRLLGVAAVVVLGSAFFSCLSTAIAGIVLTRDRLMGIGQAITMPLFFGSNALHPVDLMPGWLQAVSRANPLSYQVDALRGLLIGTPSHLPLDFAVLVLAALAGIGAASALLGRLAR